MDICALYDFLQVVKCFEFPKVLCKFPVIIYYYYPRLVYSLCPIKPHESRQFDLNCTVKMKLHTCEVNAVAPLYSQLR